MTQGSGTFPSLTSIVRSWRTPIISFALALISCIWLAATMQVSSQHDAMLRTAEHETNNLSIVVAQGINRTASDLDRILKYLRSTYERNDYNVDWPKLVQEEFTAHRQSVQIAVMDPRGMMITSTKMLYPPKPVDLSDREHYRAHLDTNEDRLFISKPMVGRASNKWSVQFTRRLRDRDGNFGGVVVISLDPTYLTRAYVDVALGQTGGLALVGLDGVVRAEGGIFKGYLGKQLPIEAAGISEKVGEGETSIRFEEKNGGLTVLAVRGVFGIPLKIVIARSDLLIYKTWVNNRLAYMSGAAVLSVIVFLAMLFTLHRRSQYEARLSQLARFDSLTQLPNRHEFHAQLAPMLRERDRPTTKPPFAIHIIDLDRFKEINDLYGHPVGDKLLIAVGERIRANTRAIDTSARLGGDEFAVIQRHSGAPKAAVALAGRLCHEISRPYIIEGNFIEIGASIGIVEDGERFDDETELMRAADLALYSVKTNGRNSYCLFEERMNEEAKLRREIEVGLREALLSDGFDVHYQPIVDVATGVPTGYEALLRWQHPTRGNIPPVEFIPIAEQTGLIVDMGAWVLKRACSEIVRRSDTLSIAVNISAIEFRTSDITATVMRVLDETGLPASRLTIEITESMLLNHGEQTMGQIKALRGLGVHIGIDDFGTGYSSLTYLQNYPVDCVKIDRSFVNNLGTGRNATAIIKAIVALASGMGMSTVAEGVETKEQLDQLSALGCREVQGYLLSKPKPANEILPPVYSEEKDSTNLRAVA